MTVSYGKTADIKAWFQSSMISPKCKTMTNDQINLYLHCLQLGMMPQDADDAIRSACDFFNIPMPSKIYDVTDAPNGKTMFLNHDVESYEDDVLCLNMNQLAQMNIKGKEAFSLIMTHECAHRVLQNTKLPGVNNGAWEHELAADFMMGCRAGFYNIDESQIVDSLMLTCGSRKHPEGELRVLCIRCGMSKAREMQRNGLTLTPSNMLDEFMAFRRENLSRIRRYQIPYYL